MRRLTTALGATLLLLVLASCTTATPPAPGPTTSAPDIDSHESGPASPIAYGVSVPDGAVQLGPLVRYRSAALIKAYTPELESAQAEAAIEAEQNADPTATPPTTTPTPDNAPQKDTFDLLENRPKADTFVSLMRIDDDPTMIVRRMLASLSVLLPEQEIVTDDLSAYCKAENRRVTGCNLDVTGRTPGGRELHVVLTVDPGNVTTRTANAASLDKPVMTLLVAYIGDPREGQENRTPEKLDDPPKTDDTAEATGWIWPKMDEDAPVTEPILDGWTPPSSATVLLSGQQWPFATMTTPRASIATQISDGFIAERSTTTPSSDIISDLNEIITTTWTPGAKPHTEIRTVHLVSARGNYLTMFEMPTRKVR